MEIMLPTIGSLQPKERASRHALFIFFGVFYDFSVPAVSVDNLHLDNICIPQVHIFQNSTRNNRTHRSSILFLCENRYPSSPSPHFPVSTPSL